MIRRWLAALSHFYFNPLYATGGKPKRKIPLFNGNLDCRLFLLNMVAGSNREK